MLIKTIYQERKTMNNNQINNKQTNIQANKQNKYRIIIIIKTQVYIKVLHSWT